MSGNFKHDRTGIKSRSTSAQSHVVGGASGGSFGKSDPAAGFHGRGSSSTGHKVAGASGGPKQPKKKL